ncbi:MAG: hypothetical protein R3F11_26155 [Verrucomicrobiales bacterium]
MRGSPEWRAIHDRWAAVAARYAPNCSWRLPDPALPPALRVSPRADAMVTTSVAEGFGLAFLEPWLAGKPVVGRDLPEITADFAESGVDLAHLYARLEIPLAWVDAGRFRRALNSALARAYAAYGAPMPPMPPSERGQRRCAATGWTSAASTSRRKRKPSPSPPQTGRRSAKSMRPI